MSHCDPPGAVRASEKAGSPPNLFAKKKNFLLNLVPRAKAAVHHCFWGHERLPCTTPSGIVGRIMEFFPKDQWSRYDYNGCLSTGQLTRMGRFENAAGLSIAFYSWEVPNPKGSSSSATDMVCTPRSSS